MTRLEKDKIKAEKLRVLAAIINKSVSFQHIIKYPAKQLENRNNAMKPIPTM